MPRETPPASAPPVPMRTTTLPVAAIVERHRSTSPSPQQPSTSNASTFPQLSKSVSMPAESHVGVRRRRPQISGNPQPARSLSRAQSIKETLSTGAAHFFGVPPKPTVALAADAEEVARDRKWQARRLRHMSRRYGEVRDPPADQMAMPGIDELATDFGQLPTPLSTTTMSTAAGGARDSLAVVGRHLSTQQSVDGSQTAAAIGRTASQDSQAAKIRVLQRRDSVAKMAWEGLSTLVTRGSLKPRQSSSTLSSTLKRRQFAARSFQPTSVTGADDLSVFGSVSNIASAGIPGVSDDVFSSQFAAAPIPRTELSLPESIQMATIKEERRSRDEPPPIAALHPQRGGDVAIRLDAVDVNLYDRPPSYGSTMGDDGIDGAIKKLSRVPEVEVEDESASPYQHLHDGDQTDGIQRIPMPPPPPSSSLPVDDKSPSLHDDVFFDLSPVRTTPHHHHASPSVGREPTWGGAPFVPVGHAAHVIRRQREAREKQLMGYRLPAAGHRQISPTKLPKSAQKQTKPFEFPPVPKRQFVRPTVVTADVQSSQAIRVIRSEPLNSAIGAKPKSQHIHHRRPVAVDRPEVPEDLKGAKIRPIKGIRRLKQKTAQQEYPSLPSASQQPPAAVQEPWTLSNFWSRLMDHAFDNSNRRRVGEGAMGKLFGRTIRRRSELSKHVRQQLDDFDDHRPFFTYWITTVQIVVTLLAVVLYGVGPIGLGRSARKATVLHKSLTKKQVSYFERDNLWIGPRYSALVHLGAKFSPCMRRDKKVYDVIEKDRRTENQTGCCIYNDKTGCFQATKQQCPGLIARHLKWSATDKSQGPNGRTSGSVCGQDPRTCELPMSINPYEWPDDITQWPICEKASVIKSSNLPNIECEITGRPCCIRILGECRITTPEFCEFVNGYFHEEATLCSQVSCLQDVCGMIPFFRTNKPDQFYRLFTSLFLHAGLLHCVVTAVLQFYLMRDLEKLLGWARIAIIYLGSGMAANLASAVFVPYVAEVGPAGSQFALLASLFVDAIYSWKMIVKPWKAVFQLAGLTLFLFVVGLLPWVDNWAHAFGFMFGLLLSLALFPYIQFDRHDRTKRLVILVVSLLACALLLAMLVLLFYVTPLWECELCRYFNCIPFTDHLCDNQGLDLDLLPI